MKLIIMSCLYGIVISLHAMESRWTIKCNDGTMLISDEQKKLFKLFNDLTNDTESLEGDEQYTIEADISCQTFQQLLDDSPVRWQQLPIDELMNVFDRAQFLNASYIFDSLSSCLYQKYIKEQDLDTLQAALKTLREWPEEWREILYKKNLVHQIISQKAAKKVPTSQVSYNNYVHDAVMSDDGMWIATLGNKKLRVRNTQTREEKIMLESQKALEGTNKTDIDRVGIFNDQSTLFAALIKKYESLENKQSKMRYDVNRDMYYCSDYDEKYLIQLFNLNDGKLLATLKPDEEIKSMLFTPDASQLVLATPKKQLMVWDTKDFAPLKTISCYDESHLPYYSDEEQQEWNDFDREGAQEERETQLLEQGHYWAQILSFNNDGTHLFVNDDAIIECWDLQTGTCLKKIELPVTVTYGLAVKPQLLIGVTVEDGWCLRDLVAHYAIMPLIRGGENIVKLTNKGTYLYTGSNTDLPSQNTTDVNFTLYNLTELNHIRSLLPSLTLEQIIALEVIIKDSTKPLNSVLQSYFDQVPAETKKLF